MPECRRQAKLAAKIPRACCARMSSARPGAWVCGCADQGAVEPGPGARAQRPCRHPRGWRHRTRGIRRGPSSRHCCELDVPMQLVIRDKRPPRHAHWGDPDHMPEWTSVDPTAGMSVSVGPRPAFRARATLLPSGKTSGPASPKGRLLRLRKGGCVAPHSSTHGGLLEDRDEDTVGK